MRKVVFLLVLGCLFLLLIGCGGTAEYLSKASYFDGTVAVEYEQTRITSHNDYLTFRFYEEGTYEISFSITPERSTRGQEYLPQDFEITIDDVPREVVKEQYILPDFLRITITRNGESETHDFS